MEYCGLCTFFEFMKATIPTESEMKVEFSHKLRKYNISLSQYKTAYKQKKINHKYCICIQYAYQSRMMHNIYSWPNELLEVCKLWIIYTGI